MGGEGLLAKVAFEKKLLVREPAIQTAQEKLSRRGHRKCKGPVAGARPKKPCGCTSVGCGREV